MAKECQCMEEEMESFRRLLTSLYKDSIFNLILSEMDQMVRNIFTTCLVYQITSEVAEVAITQHMLLTGWKINGIL